MAFPEEHGILIPGFCCGGEPALPPALPAVRGGETDRTVLYSETDLNGHMECGCCSYGCPAHRPLVQTNKLAKAQLAAWQKLKKEQAEKEGAK